MADEEANQIDETQDTAQPVRTIMPPPPIAASAPPMVAAPGARSIIDPNIRSRMEMARTMSAFPLDQAQQAVNTAIRFQAQRGYQQDVQNGKPAAEALMKWAPMLSNGPRGTELGQAASFIRATAPTVPKPVNVGGVLYNIAPGGQSVTETPGQRRVIKPPAGLAADLADARKTLDGYVKEIEKVEASDDKTLKKQLPTLRQRRTDLENYVQMKELQQSPRQILATPGAAPVPAGPAPSAATSSSMPQKVTSQAEFDALPSGTVYVGKNGKRYRKP